MKERGNRFARSQWLALAFVALPVLTISIFLLYPAFSTILGSFFQTTADGRFAFSLDGYQFFFTDSYSLHNLWRTFLTTITALAVIIAINLPVALYIRFRRGGPLAALIQGLALFPMFVPGIIICYGLIRYLGPNGWLQSLFEAVGLGFFETPIHTFWGPVIGLVWDGMPLTFLILLSGLYGISKSAVEAARDVGAGRAQILFHIILPQIKISLLIIAAFNFLYFFSQVLMPFMLGPASPEMMGPFMLRTFTAIRDTDQAATQATITFLICSLAGLAYVRALARKRGEETS